MDLGEMKIIDSISNEEDEDILEENYHYVGLSFENKQFTTRDNPIFQEKYYEYKTTEDLREGQLIHIYTPYGKSLVCVRKPIINEAELEYDKDSIKEVDICRE